MHLQIFDFEQRVRAMSGFKMKLRRSAIFVAANCKNDKAPSGAAYSGNDFERSLLTELGNLSGVSSTKISLLAELEHAEFTAETRRRGETKCLKEICQWREIKFVARYNRYRRNYGYTNWSRYHQSQRQELARIFGGIENDILEVFLNLPSFARNGLLSRYGEKNGRGAEQHARRAYADWQSGAVKPAAKTLERLVELLPPFLSEAQRFDLIRKLRAHHLKREELYLTTTPEQWHAELTPLIQKLFEHGAQFILPPVVYQKATWLANGNSTVAQNILRVIDEEEAHLRLSRIENEFNRIEFLVANVKNLEPVRHKIELPQGSILVTIQKQRKTIAHKIIEFFRGGQNMENENENDKLVPQVKPSGEIIRRVTPGNILDTSLEKLPEEQQRKLADKVAEEKISLGVSAEKAEQRHYDSSRDMANTIRAADALERTTRSDYEVKGTFDTASGRTDIKIKKNNNTVIIVVAIVVGIVILLLLKH